MDLLEYQARGLFAAHGVPVPAGAVADNPDEARFAAALLHQPVMVKAQVPAGGRGKAGGVRMAQTAAQSRGEPADRPGVRLADSMDDAASLAAQLAAAVAAELAGA